MGNWIKETLGQGVEFVPLKTRVRNGTNAIILANSLVQFDLLLSTSSASYGAKNYKEGDPNSAFLVVIPADATEDGHGYFAVLDEDLPADGGYGKAWLRHPKVKIRTDAGCTSGTPAGAGPNAGLLDTTPALASKIIARSRELSVQAVSGTYEFMFNGIEGMGVI